MLSSDGIHTVERINDETFRIDERGIANAYLLLGSESALLIDCGVGVGSIRRTAEELTALPLTLALTHRHCDHAGGRGFFPEYFAPALDRGPAFAFMSSDLAGKVLLKVTGVAELALSKKPYRSKAVFFGDGKRFELGGRTVSVKSVPGHTRGSVAFIDEKYRMLFTGDDVNPYLWMQLPGATTLSGWLPGAREILALADTYTLWAGHENGIITRQGVADVIAVVEKLLAEGPKGRGGTVDYPAADAPIHVIVTKNRIR